MKDIRAYAKKRTRYALLPLWPDGIPFGRPSIRSSQLISAILFSSKLNSTLLTRLLTLYMIPDSDGNPEYH